MVFLQLSIVMSAKLLQDNFNKTIFELQRTLAIELKSVQLIQ
jgi:hypothetical protein